MGKQRRPPPPPGTTGLYHVGNPLPDSGGARRTRFGVSSHAGIRLDGASDHGVSEALYLHDPDFNGVELYRDRPKDEWPRDPDGSLGMFTRPLDLESLLAEPELA